TADSLDRFFVLGMLRLSSGSKTRKASLRLGHLPLTGLGLPQPDRIFDRGAGVSEAGVQLLGAGVEIRKRTLKGFCVVQVQGDKSAGHVRGFADSRGKQGFGVMPE
ncbi:MAG: hypothetical protein AAEJ16_00395, partial [Arenicellales bacterium]